MKFKTIAVTAMAVTLSGAGAFAVTQIATAGPALADDNGKRGQMKRANYRRSEFRGSRGARGMFGGPRIMGKIMREADTDGDMAISQEEIDAFIIMKVEGADANGDGDLSIEEFDVIFRDLTRSVMVNAFQRLDEDGTGTITSEEIDVRFGDVVARMDRNEDGKLSLNDRRRGRHGKRGEHHRRQHRQGERGENGRSPQN